MTAQDALVEVLARVAAQNGGTVFIGADELAQWPATAVTAMKSAGWLRATSPAQSAVCPGCERNCTMPVNVLKATPTSPGRAFIVCDKRSDVNRVALPVGSLSQWQASGESLAEFLLRSLEIPGAVSHSTTVGVWRIGVFRGGEQAAQLLLNCTGSVCAQIAGHSIPLEELLALQSGTFKIDRRRLTIAVNNPAAGAGDVETAEARRVRLQRRVNQLRAEGCRSFMKTTATEEGFSVSRLQQILAGNEEKPKKRKPATWLD